DNSCVQSSVIMGWSAIHCSAAHDDTTGRTYVTGGYSPVSNYYSNMGYFTSHSGDAFTNSPNQMTTARHNHGLFIIGDYMYAVGGSNSGGILSTVERMPLSTQVWSAYDTLQTMTVQPKTDAGFASDGEYIYIFGGQSASGTYDDFILRYDPQMKETVLMNAVLPSPRAACSAVYDFDQHLFIIAGGHNSVDGALDEILYYDPVGDVIGVISQTLPAGAYHMTGVFDDALFLGGVMGGSGSSDAISLKYIKNPPQGSDIITENPEGVITLDSEYPRIMSRDLVEAGSGLSVLNWQLQTGSSYYFEVEAWHLHGAQWLEQVDIWAWFDGGVDPGAYDEETGGNSNFHFKYLNNSDTGNLPQATLEFPS
ncbi:MAG TPA: hypothetical protein ENN76_00905, partial [Euryarchaeota archaeon]|nr:hypothetical protein [Euryarchaeota archaeon]